MLCRCIERQNIFRFKQYATATDQRRERKAQRFWLTFILNEMLFIVQIVSVFYLSQDFGCFQHETKSHKTERKKNIWFSQSWADDGLCTVFCVRFKFLSLFIYPISESESKSGMESAIVIWLVIIKHEKHGRKIGIVINRVWRAFAQRHLHIPFSVNVRNSIRMAEHSPTEHSTALNQIENKRKNSSKRWEKTRTRTRTHEKSVKIKTSSRAKHNTTQKWVECEKEIYANGKWHSEAFYIVIPNMDSLSIMRYVWVNGCACVRVRWTNLSRISFENNHKSALLNAPLFSSNLCVCFTTRQANTLLSLPIFLSVVQFCVRFASDCTYWPAEWKNNWIFRHRCALHNAIFFLFFFAPESQHKEENVLDWREKHGLNFWNGCFCLVPGTKNNKKRVGNDG